MEFEITRLTFYSHRKLLEATELDVTSRDLFGLIIPEFTLNMRKNVRNSDSLCTYRGTKEKKQNHSLNTTLSTNKSQLHVSAM